MSTSTSKVCVIGGSGFIGTRLCQRLERAGTPFFIVDKTLSKDFPERTRLADVRDAKALHDAIEPGASIVLLAAEHRDDVRPLSLYDEVNVGGARHVCEVARARGITRIVFTSTVAVYGFAPIGTDESGQIAPFNDYGRTKHEAEGVLRAWQAEAPALRSLAVLRPTVVFGERNRGNVYNLLRQIATGRFLMVGSGTNRKSMAYVENVAAFLEYALGFEPGASTFNFVDKPDVTMNELVATVRRMFGKPDGVGMRMPFVLGLAMGKAFDMAAAVTGRKFPISTIRVRKFCANSVYGTALDHSGFVPPVALSDALERTIRHEFIDQSDHSHVFYSE